MSEQRRIDLIKKHKLSDTETPSQYPFQVFALCPPVYVDNAVQNNPWMKKGQTINKERFLAQWYNFYSILAANALVYLITPTKGLQDQTYVNCFMYLPHIKKNDVIILSNFTAPGRAGEEEVAGSLLEDLGYQIVKCPHKFEGEPELKYIKDNIYLGGYGIRTDYKTHLWLQDNWNCRIIPVRETDEKLYHLDCMAFPMGRENLMLCTDMVKPETIKKIEKVVNVVPISKNGAYMGACNSLKVDDVIYNSSDLQFKKRTDEDYEKERKKNAELEKICSDLGMEIVYVDLSECEKSGAYLSCFVAHLNWRDD